MISSMLNTVFHSIVQFLYNLIIFQKDTARPFVHWPNATSLPGSGSNRMHYYCYCYHHKDSQIDSQFTGEKSGQAVNAPSGRIPTMGISFFFSGSGIVPMRSPA